MSGFADDVARFAQKVEARSQAVFVGTVAEAKTSIVEGSPITGAPGQPVDTGNLRSSWQAVFESRSSALISTNVAYARSNEDGVARPGGGPYRLLSRIGGRHSVKLTIVGLPRLVAYVTRQLGFSR